MSDSNLENVFKTYGWAWDPEREPSPDQLKVIQMDLANPLSTLQMSAPQLLGHYYGITHPKHILAMDKGMGKTVVYLSVGLHGEPEHVIVICPTNAMAAQRREILRHFPFYADKFVIVRGQSHQRHKQWRTPNARIFICTMATFQSDIGKRTLRRGSDATSESIVPAWVHSSSGLDSLHIDEFHKYIRRRSKTWEALKGLQPQRLIPDSGSPVSSGPHELWPALHLVDRKKWSSYWRYVETFCDTIEGWGGRGKEILGPKNVEAWRNAIAPDVFYRKKDPRDYPPKSRFLVDVELPDWQRKLHDDLRDKLIAISEDSDAIIVAKTKLDALYRARIGLICPKALDESFDVGAGIEFIADDAEDLDHFVVTTPFRAPVPHLKDYLESKGRKVWILMGGLGIDPDTQDRIINEFESQGGALIQTTKYATSYEFINGPEHNYCLGYEYDPEDNKQAEDRFQRLSSTRPSFHWYLRFLNTYDEDLIDRIVIKGQNVNAMFDRGKYWDAFK